MLVFKQEVKSSLVSKWHVSDVPVIRQPNLLKVTWMDFWAHCQRVFLDEEWQVVPDGPEKCMSWFMWSNGIVSSKRSFSSILRDSSCVLFCTFWSRLSQAGYLPLLGWYHRGVRCITVTITPVKCSPWSIDPVVSRVPDTGDTRAISELRVDRRPGTSAVSAGGTGAPF